MNMTKITKPVENHDEDVEDRGSTPLISTIAERIGIQSGLISLTTQVQLLPPQPN